MKVTDQNGPPGRDASLAGGRRRARQASKNGPAEGVAPAPPSPPAPRAATPRAPRARRIAKSPQFTASIYPADGGVLPPDFVQAVRDLEAELKQPVWLLVQGHDAPEPFDSFEPLLIEPFVQQKANMPRGGAAVLIESPGGDAHTAYGLASLFKRRCGRYSAIVSRWAKSAATLFTLGADKIYMGEDAQIGPLDAQFPDRDREETWMSALDEVGAVDSLQRTVMEAAAASLRFMSKKTGKKLNVLMPPVFELLANLHKPLFEKVDTLRYSKMSRVLDIAQQYALRLLRHRYSEVESWAIASELVTRYPSHRFWIDRSEAQRIGKREGGPPIGLPIAPLTPRLDSILDRLYGLSDGSITAIGRLQGVKP